VEGLANGAAVGSESAVSNTPVEESQSAVDAFEQTCKEACAEVEGIFADVEGEFASIEAVKTRFAEWKQNFRQSYADAYVAHSMPDILAPFVRCEMLNWQPLENPEVSTMKWFRLLADFSEGEDGDLVPRLFRTAAVPIAQEAVTNQWDPYSAASCKRVVRLWEELTDFLEPTDDELKDILRVVVRRFSDAATSLTEAFEGLPKAPQDNEAALRLLDLLLAASRELLSNVAVFEGSIAAPALQRIAFGGLIDKLLQCHLMVQGSAAAASVMGLLRCLPASWNEDGAPKAASVLMGFVKGFVRIEEDANWPALEEVRDWLKMQ